MRLNSILCLCFLVFFSQPVFSQGLAPSSSQSLREEGEPNPEFPSDQEDMKTLAIILGVTFPAVLVCGLIVCFCDHRALSQRRAQETEQLIGSTNRGLPAVVEL